jgi:uncharacterized membrane protein (DUF485 family)
MLSVLFSYFSIELLLNIFFAILVVLLTFVLSKILTVKAGDYLEKTYE